MITLRVLTREDVETARRWRVTAPEALRTPYPLTAEMQSEFYDTVISNRAAPHRYWAAERDGQYVAMTGLTYIQWENGLAEISLITNPGTQGQGIGTDTVEAVLREAFHAMRLLTVIGECYRCNPAIEFWERLVARHHGHAVALPRRKWWDGQLWDSYYFTFSAHLVDLP